MDTTIPTENFTLVSKNLSLASENLFSSPKSPLPKSPLRRTALRELSPNLKDKSPLSQTKKRKTKEIRILNEEEEEGFQSSPRVKSLFKSLQHKQVIVVTEDIIESVKEKVKEEIEEKTEENLKEESNFEYLKSYFNQHGFLSEDIEELSLEEKASAPKWNRPTNYEKQWITALNVYEVKTSKKFKFEVRNIQK